MKELKEQIIKWFEQKHEWKLKFQRLSIKPPFIQRLSEDCLEFKSNKPDQQKLFVCFLLNPDFTKIIFLLVLTRNMIQAAGIWFYSLSSRALNSMFAVTGIFMVSVPPSSGR